MKPAITRASLENHPHTDSAISGGEFIHMLNELEFAQRESGFIFRCCEVGSKEYIGALAFTDDGLDLKGYKCSCRPGISGKLCKHVVAAVYAIQDGDVDMRIIVGNTATVESVVQSTDLASSVGSGDLEVFATPMMIALMERAACAVLTDAFDPGMTSVGTQITVDHTAPSVIDASICATATITEVKGKTIIFTVTAQDGFGEIGKGTHTRVIVDTVAFMKRAEERRVEMP